MRDTSPTGVSFANTCTSGYWCSHMNLPLLVSGQHACPMTYWSPSCIYIYIYIHIYIYTERERERDIIHYICVYIYIYIYMCIHIYIYIYNHNDHDNCYYYGNDTNPWFVSSSRTGRSRIVTRSVAESSEVS